MDITWQIFVLARLRKSLISVEAYQISKTLFDYFKIRIEQKSLQTYGITSEFAKLIMYQGPNNSRMQYYYTYKPNGESRVEDLRQR